LVNDWQKRDQKNCFIVSGFATILAFVVVLLGAYTRLTDAGLGCPDWPGCYGEWIISKSTAIQNPNMDPTKAWTEMIHRYLAGLLGLTIFLLNYFILWRRRLFDQVSVLSLTLLGLVIFQALLGMWTVTHNLSPLIVMAHLLGGMTTLSLLWWLTLNLKPKTLKNPIRKSTRSLKVMAGLSLSVLWLQLFLGGWTSANYAALVCLDFPECHKNQTMKYHIIEAFALTTPEITKPFDHATLATIHMLHRFGALLTALMIGGLALFAYFRIRHHQLRVLSTLLGVLLLIQIGLGITNVLSVLPLSIAVAHNGVAGLLLLVLITFNVYLYTHSMRNSYVL